MTTDQLIHWRHRLGLSQAKAAENLGCGRKSLQNWEAGRSPVPKYIALACIALALGIHDYPENSE